jgi:hypothetical protein
MFLIPAINNAYVFPEREEMKTRKLLQVSGLLGSIYFFDKYLYSKTLSRNIYTLWTGGLREDLTNRFHRSTHPKVNIISSNSKHSSLWISN